jgi:SAM-dependent methyltransferase
MVSLDRPLSPAVNRLGHLMRTLLGVARGALRVLVPRRARSWCRSQQQMLRRQVRSGKLTDWPKRIEPVSHQFGFDRGNPIDRHYIENFLVRHAEDIQGRVLEIADDVYTRKFGGQRVLRSDVLHAQPGNPSSTLVADLTCADAIPTNTFDCIILTQTLHCIYDMRAALRHLHRILKPGGVLLATFPGISQVSRYDMERWGDYWRFTDASARRLFGEVFGPEHVTVETHGNVLAACAFLHGLAAQELKQEELDYHDQDYQVIITVRAVKPGIAG